MLEWNKRRGLIDDWKFESKTFWFHGIKRGCVSYKPDFWVKSMGEHHWIEVKGYMDRKSATKIKRFKKYFPEERLYIIDKKWYAKNNRIFSSIIKDWEK